jgi:hypothetical protein
VERLNLRNLNELKIRKQYQNKVSKRVASLEKLNDSQDINRAWENIRENIKISAKESLGLYELKSHKPWFDEKRLGFLDQSKNVKTQWLQDPNQNNVDNLNDVRRGASIHFGNKRKESLKTKIDNYANKSNRNISETCIRTSVI